MIINLRPRTKGRPRMGRRRKVYTPQQTLEFEKKIREAWLEHSEQDTIPAGTPVGMSIEFGSNHIEIEVWELDEKIRPKHVTGDLDNYVKAVSDGLNGVAYEDDRQVQYLDVRFTRSDKGAQANPGS